MNDLHKASREFAILRKPHTLTICPTATINPAIYEVDSLSKTEPLFICLCSKFRRLREGIHSAEVSKIRCMSNYKNSCNDMY